MNCLVVITSYQRKEMLYNLLNQLNYNDTIVFDDASTYKYDMKYQYVRFSKNYGKEGAWLKYTQIYRAIPKTYDYYIFLGDDMEVGETFITSAIKKYDDIDDINKICLSLLSDNRVNQPQWTKFKPIVKGEYIQTQWNDLCFICDNRFFDNVNIQPIGFERWHRNSRLGSGVGEQISQQLHKKGFTMYHLKESLVKHGNHDSLMNPEERKRNPIINK